ncbi:MAG: Ppx/GppA phosphatase family protein [Myxococcota bacterium]
MDDSTETLAAIDLGSNSFHMLIARVSDNGQLTVVDRQKDMVRLGGGLGPGNSLSPDAQERALESLARMGERLRGMPQGSVRAVGTNTLRKAKAPGFLQKAQAALGHPIDIIAGVEEGRLIYLGVARGVHAPPDVQRLVVDIGGGSTEVVIGKELDVVAVESLYMGCVSFSLAHFPDGALTARAFEAATLAARQELRALEHTFPAIGWAKAIGTSGTIKAVHHILAATGSTPQITLDALYELRERALRAGHLDALDLDGLSERRRPVFPGGLAILIGVFESLHLNALQHSEFALREGVLYDLHGRTTNQDVREATITRLMNQYEVDVPHALRIERTACELLDAVARDWGLGATALERQLRWACRIHEIGLAIAHGRYHKHGSYIVENADLPGFSRQDQNMLWALVRTHRRRFKPHRFDGLPEDLPTAGRRLCVLMRLAVVLERARIDHAIPKELEVFVDGKRITLVFPPGWLDASPLTRADLESEKVYLHQGGFILVVEEASP